MGRKDRQDELDFIRRWRGDDPWGRAASRSRSARRATEQNPDIAAAPEKARARMRRSFPLFENSSVRIGPPAPPSPAEGKRIDFGDPSPAASRWILSDPDADRSIRTAFPRAEIDLPGGEYCRIVHPLGPGAGEDPELSRLPSSGLLFDLETLGFHGRPLFLIGILYPEPVIDPATRSGPEPAAEPGSGPASEPAAESESDPAPEPGDPTDRWKVVQLLARDYAEEDAILEAFAEVAGEQEPWVSFNGKSFDLPFLRERARFHRRRLPEPTRHLDLLHSARRVYRGVLPNCRLQTLESALFARYRYEDLPGDEIPAAYHDYVRTGEEEEMVRILRHNRDDLVTLARLHVHLSES